VVLMTTDATGYETLEDVVAAAKADPGGLVYVGSPGSIPHVAMIGLEKTFDISMKGIQGNTGQALKHINGGVAHLNAALPIPGMKPLAVFSAEEDPNHPGLPTVNSSGADLEFSIWMGVVEPKDTPDEVVAALDTACAAATSSDGFIENMGKLNWPIAYKNASDFRAFYDAEFETLGGLLEAAGLKQ
jgi:tripartite-type tricarboxylate transporter receptor subunit TctC